MSDDDEFDLLDPFYLADSWANGNHARVAELVRGSADPAGLAFAIAAVVCDDHSHETAIGIVVDMARYFNLGTQ